MFPPHCQCFSQWRHPTAHATISGEGGVDANMWLASLRAADVKISSTQHETVSVVADFKIQHEYFSHSNLLFPTAR